MFWHVSFWLKNSEQIAPLAPLLRRFESGWMQWRPCAPKRQQSRRFEAQ